MSKSEEILAFFERICQIPHVSRNEAKLREFLVDFFADKEDFATQVDSYGNLKIARKKTIEGAKKIILQAHLDMVPQALDKSFDFTKQGIKTKIENGKLMSACGTTLGADDGIGVAAAVVALLDDELKNCNIEAIFTVEEEIGLNGAANLDENYLANCDYLLNLDSEDWGEIFIGCAGGVRLDTLIKVKSISNKRKFTYQITLKNLKGGHSGCDIHLARANAIIELLKFAKICGFELGNITGGTLDNAIPRECIIVAASDLTREEIELKASEFIKEFYQTFSDEENVEILISECDEKLNEVYENSAEIIENLSSVKNAVISFDSQLGVVETSSNFASVKSQQGEIVITSSQRSLYNKKRDEINSEIISHFEKIGGVSVRRAPYPAWEKIENSCLTEAAVSLYKELFGVDVNIAVIPAGLECGIFSEKNQKMQMLSFGPTVKYPHSPSEYLEVDTLKDFYCYLQQLIKKIS